MPLTVIVRTGSDGADAGDEPSLTFDGTRVVVGRGDGCDVRLPDPTVSQRHASIHVNGAEHTLVDEESANGTFVGGSRLAPRAPRVVKSGDLVRVGRVWLEIRIGHAPATPNLAAATRDMAMALVSQAMQALDRDTVAKVLVVEGRDRGAVLRLEDEGRAYVIGRGDDCDLLLDDADISREHVQVVRRGTVALLRDAGSKNGVFLGETRVPAGRDVAWKPTWTVRLGKTVLALEEPVADALAELEAAADEPIPPDEPVPAPPPSRAADAPEPPASAHEKPASAAPAPIAHLTNATPAPSTRRRNARWSPTDVAVIVAAMLVIALSIGGLFWLLHG